MPDQTSPPDIPASDSRLAGAETAGYILAVIVLVFIGSLLLTVVLNWISGPVIVIAAVALTTSLKRRRLAR
jgi:fatty acid desaturase